MFVVSTRKKRVGNITHIHVYIPIIVIGPMLIELNSGYIFGVSLVFTVVSVLY